MRTVKKIIKYVSLIISFGFIALSGIEFISGLLGEISLFGFNLTEAQQQITHYITSGGLAIVGGGGVLINELLNNKLNEARKQTNLVLEKFLTLYEKYEVIEKTIKNLDINSTNRIQELKNEIYTQKIETQELVKLVKVDLETKLSNTLIDIKTKELINKALGYGEEQEE